MTITNNYNFDMKSPIVTAVLDLFDIQSGDLHNKTIEQRQNFLKRKILDCIEEKLKSLPGNEQTV